MFALTARRAAQFGRVGLRNVATKSSGKNQAFRGVKVSQA